jgi:hypothetical protein
MSNMGSTKDGVLGIRRGATTKRLEDLKARMEKTLGIAITWPQFFDSLLNRLAELENHKKLCR